MIEVIETSGGVEVSEVGDVTVIEVGVSGPQGPPGTLIEVSEDDVIVVTPLRELDFGTGFDVTTPLPRVAQIALDLSELAAGGELAGTLDAPTIDALHSGSTHQSVLDEIDAHEIDVVGAHDGSAIAFTPGHGIMSADVQSAIEEVADEVAGGHPDLATHDALGLATDAELATHAATPHGTAHPDLATHDALGLATDSELSTHAADTTAIHGITDTSVLETTTGSQGKVDTHTGDTSDAHDASAISVDSTTLVGTGTDVQAVLEEMDDAIAAGSGAPTGADYLVGTAQGGLSAEIVVGTAPGGELGNTWASPTVDASHSGSTHAATQSAAEATAAAADAAHVAASDPHTGYLKESNTIDFLVGTATGELAGELVVGTTPGGELGNTWASPTVDATHSGSSHAGTQAAAEATASAADAAHVAAGDPHAGYELESAHTKAAHDALGLSHDVLADVSADDHHAQAHTLASHSTKAHSELTSVGADDHHAQAHAAAHGNAGADKVVDSTQGPSTQASGDAAAVGADVSKASPVLHKHAFPTLFIPVSFAIKGAVATGTGVLRWYNRSGRTLTFDSVSASVGTAPTGAALIADVNIGGTTIYTTQASRPTIAISSNVHDDTTAPDVTTITDNSYLTVDVDQVGSTVAGSDLTVTIWLRG